MKIQDNSDLLNYLVSKADSGVKNWFNFQEQKVAGISVCYEIAKNHADTMTPDQVVEYVADLNNAIYNKFFKLR
jgi:hypothetical protein